MRLDANTNAYPDSHANTDSYTDSYTDTNAYADPDTHSNTDSYAHSNAYANPDTNAFRRHCSRLARLHRHGRHRRPGHHHGDSNLDRWQ